ncbi:hypothetical protein BO94DRAFT_559700 [Aspergillus sclerotioniger CBS 115572]|uniref:Uncharacterized protein n=1 Tax=Aspergillus sclerotioniger CBS 115572 TaxID=1450535 RepID=A0A317VL45_9EURO|nr:hypothetical protein BO94DRAFT_559700 [Aspergillus sclerotioniger CBS 115572]PWY74565.1 hypothetical protein BO94DRAFT_559700 [Aspergillus sclerotioniger CBS 115572]
MVSKAIGCLHPPKLSSYQPFPSCDWVCAALSLPRLGPWGCNMDFIQCRVSPTYGSETIRQTRGESGLVRNELLQTFLSAASYQATRSLDCHPAPFSTSQPVLGAQQQTANRPKRLAFPSSLSRFLINPPRSRIEALNPTVLSLTWTSGTLG